MVRNFEKWIQLEHAYVHPTLFLKAADKNGTLKSDRLNGCVQFSKPRMESLKLDSVNGPSSMLITSKMRLLTNHLIISSLCVSQFQLLTFPWADPDKFF